MARGVSDTTTFALLGLASGFAALALPRLLPLPPGRRFGAPEATNDASAYSCACNDYSLRMPR
jgi:hypothetical protein